MQCVALYPLGQNHQPSQLISDGIDADAERLLHCLDRGDVVHGRADAADARGYGGGVGKCGRAASLRTNAPPSSYFNRTECTLPSVSITVREACPSIRVTCSSLIFKLRPVAPDRRSAEKFAVSYQWLEWQMPLALDIIRPALFAIDYGIGDRRPTPRPWRC